MKDWLTLAITLVTLFNALINLQTARINRKMANTKLEQEKADKEKTVSADTENGQ